ncbi:hypothetical protein EVAR_58929_1 [Eumeta japonica]|uniref:Uncharacterized protein n=1 Tax=Eumeta variegata TaxID=151549 RepID=A0A4C1YAF1_EUMVA|nr:hypothetical protein EVAR_58929_1 [Eumeta japonica]
MVGGRRAVTGKMRRRAKLIRGRFHSSSHGPGRRRRRDSKKSRLRRRGRARWRRRRLLGEKKLTRRYGRPRFDVLMKRMNQDRVPSFVCDVRHLEMLTYKARIPQRDVDIVFRRIVPASLQQKDTFDLLIQRSSLGS